MLTVSRRLIHLALISLLLQSLILAGSPPTRLIHDEGPIFALTPNVPIRGELSKGEERSYRVALDPGQYLCAFVEAIGIDVSVTLYAPGSLKLTTLRCWENRPTPVSLIAEVSGVYRLELRSLEKDAVTGVYEISVKEIRRATVLDKSRTRSERLVAEGDQLRAAGSAELCIRAIKKYEQALSVWQSTGDKLEEAYTLKTIGEIHHQLGQPKMALEYYNRTLLLSREVKHRVLECETLSDIGYVLKHLGENESAMQRCAQALDLSREVGDRRGEARALNGIGEVFYAFGDRQKALDHHQQALQIWRDLNDRRRQAQTLLEIGYSYADLNDVERASDSYEQALALWRLMSDPRGQSLALTAIGYLCSRLGRKQEALDAYNQARPLLQLAGDPIAEAGILNGIAYVYEELGERDITLEYFAKARRIYQSANYKRGQVALLIAIGQVYYVKREFKRSLGFLQQALPALKSLNDQALESYAYKTVAAVYDSLGDKNKALIYYNKALSLYRRLGDQRGEPYALSGIAGICDGLGDKEKALEYQSRALALNRAARDRFAEVSTLFSMAHINRDLGNLTEALADVEDATGKIESLRADVTNPDLRASFIATVRQNYELYIDLLMRLHKPAAADGLDDKALHISERSRARSLVEMLAEARANIRQGVDPTLLERERFLRQSLGVKEEDYSRLLAGKHTEEQANTAAKLIDAATTDLQQTQAQIRATSPRYAALTQPQPLTLKEIQEQVLDPDTLLLEYALGDERSYLWAVTSDSLTSFELPKRAGIEAAARRVYELLTAQNQIVKGETELQKERRVARAEADYSKAAAALSQMVIGPAASQLGTKRLLVVADGALQYIPFGALPVPVADGMAGRAQASGRQENEPSPATSSQPLMVEHEIVSLPSASTLAVMRREFADRKPAPKAVAVLADPVFSRFDPRVNPSRAAASSQSDAASIPRDFERAIKEVRVSRKRSGVGRLPFSRVEAAWIKAAAPSGQTMEAIDFDASRATATSEQLSQYRIIHFATHGLLNSEHPELSGMVFSLVDRQGKPQNGFLRLHEVYNLNLPAELVVLSACQTGLGKDVKGEGLVGLTRGFMYAGAARVMASLWQVDDSATAELMKRFYAKMLGDGLRPAAALRDAQVEMWKQKRWQAPYYWAGFMLQGEWK